jgi:deoxyribonuclease-4
VIHDSYLINLAAPESDIREKSIEAFRGEIERALIIGADYLVTHPGNYRGLALEQGILNAASALILGWQRLDPVLAKDAKLTILLENTAGAGAQLGGQLEDLAAVQALASPYVGVPIRYCLDTCHCFVAGWNMATESGLEALVHYANETIELHNVPVIHSNDAKAALGSHLDRHANIGAGYIGLEGFRRILNHPQLRDKAFILETPVDKPGDAKRDVTALKELVSPRKRTILEKSSHVGTRSGQKTRRST